MGTPAHIQIVVWPHPVWVVKSKADVLVKYLTVTRGAASIQRGRQDHSSGSPRKRPHSGHSEGPVENTSRHAGHVISDLEKSMTTSGWFFPEPSRVARQSASKRTRARSKSWPATASPKVVPQEPTLAPSGRKMVASTPAACSRSATRLISLKGPWMRSTGLVSTQR